MPIGFLYSAILNDPNYIVGPGPDTPVIIGGILEIIVALAGIGTAVVLYPVLKRQNEGVALGFIGTRVLEASTIFADVVCLLAIVTLRRTGVGPEALVTGKTLVVLYGLFDLPLIVLTARLNNDPAWQEWQTELLQLSSNSQQLFAENSGHNIQVEEPDAAVAAIIQMVQQTRETAAK